MDKAQDAWKELASDFGHMAESSISRLMSELDLTSHEAVAVFSVILEDCTFGLRYCATLGGL